MDDKVEKIMCNAIRFLERLDQSKVLFLFMDVNIRKKCGKIYKNLSVSYNSAPIAKA